MKSYFSAVLAGASLLALATPVWAQDAVSPTAQQAADSDGGDIVVTARRRDESAQDVPLVVNAVTSEELARLNIRRFDDVVSVVPGLTIAQNSNGIGSTTTIRGVKYDVNASGNNGTVEYYLNEAPISAGFVLQSIFDIGQIEVLRGPQGTLRGRAAPSGSITVTTRRPDLNEIGGYLNGTGTDTGSINAQAAVGVPIIPGVLAVRVAGVVDNTDANEVHSIYPGPNPYSRTRAIRGSVRFDPVDNLSLNFMYQRLQQRFRSYDQTESVSLTNTEAGVVPTNPNAGSMLISARDRLSASNTPRDVTQDFEIFHWNADWKFAGQRLVYVGNLSKQRFQTGGSGDAGDLFGPAYTNAALQTFSQRTNSNAEQESHELRLQSDERLFGALDYVIGGLINRLDSPTSLVQQTPVFCLGTVTVPNVGALPCAFAGLGQYPSPSGFAAINNTPVETVSNTMERSLYGNLTLHLGERTELSGGARYITFRNQNVLRINGAVTGPVVDESFKHWIYTASAKHRFSDSLMVYASVGSSWRPPARAIGAFTTCSTPGIGATSPAFPTALSCAEQEFITTRPETSTSYELGVKSNLFDRRLTLNATVFHQRYQNFVYRAPGNGSPYVNYTFNTVSNTPTRSVANFNFISGVPVDVTGVEVEASLRATDNFDIGASFTYAVGKIKNGRIPCADANNDGIPDATEALPSTGSFDALGRTIQACVVNQRANDAPVFTGNIQAEYRVPLSNQADGYLRGLFTFYGASQGDPLNRYDDVSAYGLLNLYLGARDPDGRWEIQAFAKNITNTYRTLTRTSPLTTGVAFTNGSSGSFTTNYRNVTSTAPREFGLNVRYAFGSR